KAGLVPLHAWLPLAHPAAPSHVSALMSGVMTKVAVYGFIRLVFDLLGTPAWWWGELVLVLGGISAVLGLLYALLQNDLKRLLAYSTVENIGVIFIGLGLALAFQANGLQQAAALALSAALLHIINHSLFKSLLFYCAGSVLSSTGLRDMNQLGGLIHRLPQTAFAFLAGSAAIAALPPLNGFVSEWLIFQAILLGPELPQWALKFSVPAVGALLALAAALAAGCFVKAFGISFLGRPRSDAAAQAQEVNVYMRAAPLLLVALCVFAGVFPGLLLDAISPVVAQLNHSVALAPQRHNAWLSLVPVAAERSSYNGLLLLLFMLISGGLTAFVIHRAANRRLRRSAAWDCG
ncbi:MAG: hydrogenase 4 subunit B, partial [Candidatus Competibacteraceae bacterium]|nr:hydrogenase 4 subunit B [Candidatus Competibacteraceae bacterium]